MKLSDFLVPIDTYSTEYIDASLRYLTEWNIAQDSSIIGLNNEIIILNASIGDIGTALSIILGV
jgi:hypothetical protein